ncbi:DUF4249 domain-containing protein [Polluticoccus soli]|uniref:DUF4249 domain-containing protein n=1 Tax=Polluticoccus soli TaxID=3034150 RepID=UPI0023E094A0|nr:DUF4249 domain-containing protein [Flavipsychrobacter sp. JY13-12]
MNLYKIVIPVIALAFAASCTKEVKVDIPQHQSSLVISSSTLVDDTFRLQVGKSVAILNYKPSLDLSVPNATVVLYEGDKALGSMHYDNVNGVYTSGNIAEAGKKYTIKVSAPGFNAVEAESEVPSAVKIKSVQRIPNARVDIDGVQQDEVRISFDDPMDAGDFYVLSLIVPVVEDSFMHGNIYSTCVNTNDPSVESIYNESIDQNTCLSSDGIFFRDALFNGTAKELRIFVPSNVLQPVEDVNGTLFYAGIELQHVPEAYFRYQKSYRFASENMGNPFAEPTNVYSNVKNGYGIFSIVSTDYAEVK